MNTNAAYRCALTISPVYPVSFNARPVKNEKTDEIKTKIEIIFKYGKI